MSSYEPKDFRIGEPLDPLVTKHIDNLQSVFGAKDGDSRQAYIELQGAVPWIKMQSGARLNAKAAGDYNTKEGDFLAKENILFGLNTRTESTDEKGNKSISYNPDAGILPGYEDSTQFGIRPKPGITGMNIHSHNRFGSLRTAVVTFQCWTKEQMDKMEVLYMRPGLTVLLEWGHSKILKNTTSVDPSNYGIDFFTASESMPTIIRAIDTKRRNQAYSYDGIVGIIKNFSWSFRPDGGYDCQVHLVTSGDLIESYKANFYLKQDDVNAAILREIEEYKASETPVSGSSTFVFPNPSYDSKDIPYNLQDISPEVDNLYQRYCGAAQAALDMSFTYFKDYLDTLPDEAEKLLLLKNQGFDDSLGLDKLLEVIEKLFGSLKLVQGGDTLYSSTKYYLEVNLSSPLNTDGVEAFRVQSPWSNGIVNLNTAENDLEQGILKTGMIAVLPLKGEYPDMMKWLSAFQSISTRKSMVPTSRMGEVFTLMTYGEMRVGNDKIKPFAFDINHHQLPHYTISGQTILTGVTRDGYIKYNGLFSEFSAPSGTNFYGLPSYIPRSVSTNVATLNNGRRATYTYAAYNLVDLTAILNSITGNPSSGANGSTLGLAWNQLAPALTGESFGPAAFGVLWFVGFEAIEASNTDLSQVIATTDPRTGKATDESYIDPNDENLSKLHYVLRGQFENPYVSDYLRESLLGVNFSGAFKYRQVYRDTSNTLPPDEILRIFSESNGGGLRTANLQKYDGETNVNTYAQQLRSWNNVLGGRFTSADNSPTFNTVYVKLGALLELLNKHVLKSDGNYFFLFKSMYKDSKSTPLYNTIDDHISCDPEICILPHNLDDLFIEGIADTFEYSAPIILNIELGINFVLSTLNQYIDANGSVSILSFIQEILDQISRVCGGINDLQIQYVENSSLFYIVDRQAIAPVGKDKFPTLNVFGLNSIVKNVNMVSKITPKLSSMIAISAQDTSFTATQDASGFNAIMNGVTDRIFSDRYDDDRKDIITAAGENYDSIRKRLIEDVTDLKVHLQLYYVARTIPPVGKDTQPGVYQNYCNFLTGADSTYRKEGRPTYNFIIPFELQLDLYGLSGMQVMDAFRINKDILPRTYGGRKDSPIAFLITGVEQNINRGNWTTKVKTQIYNIDEKTPTKAFPDRSLMLLIGAEPGYSETASIKGKDWGKLSNNQLENAKYLYNLAISEGFNDFHARAILAVCSKESAFQPKKEGGYMNTRVKRLREIWAWLVESLPLSDDEVKLKDLISRGDWVVTPLAPPVKSETEFWDYTYGYLTPGFNGNHYGNTAPGDGEKYRGGGFNQLTFKGNFVSAQTIYNGNGSKAGAADFVTNPNLLNTPDANGIYKLAAQVAVDYFKATYKNLGSTQASALEDIFWANAGYANQGTWTESRRQGYAKAQYFLTTLPETI